MKWITILILFTVSIYASEYELFKGSNKVGNIKTLETIDKGYIVAETTKLAFVLLGLKDNVVIYKNNKPEIEIKNSKYIKDTHGFLDMLKALKDVDSKKVTIVDNTKYLFNVKCKNDICSYKGLFKETFTTLSGKIRFNEGLLSELTNNEMEMILIKKI